VIGDKAEDVGKVEGGRVITKVVVVEAANSPPKTKSDAVKIADGVTEYDARVTAPLREGSRTAEIDRAAADADLRQADRGSDSVAYAEIGWVQKAVRLEGDVNPVIADASGIGEIGPKM